MLMPFGRSGKHKLMQKRKQTNNNNYHPQPSVFRMVAADQLRAPQGPLAQSAVWPAHTDKPRFLEMLAKGARVWLLFATTLLLKQTQANSSASNDAN